MDVQFRALSLDAAVPGNHNAAAAAAVSNSIGNADQPAGAGRGSRRRQRDKRLDSRQPADLSVPVEALTASQTAHLEAPKDGAFESSGENHAAASRPRGRGRGKKQSNQNPISRTHQDAMAKADHSETPLAATNNASATTANEIDPGAAADATVPSKSKSRRRRRDQPRGSKPTKAVAAAPGVDSAEPTWTTFGDTVGRVGVVAPEVRYCRTAIAATRRLFPSPIHCGTSPRVAASLELKLLGWLESIS